MGGVRPPRVREPLLALRGVDGRGGVDGGDCAAVAAAVRSGSAKAELIIDRGRLVGGRRSGRQKLTTRIDCQYSYSI